MSTTGMLMRSEGLPTLDERVEEHLRDQTDTLYICPNAWALRHRFINTATGEMIRARCNSWRCLYCGPRKVDQWRQLIKAVEPTHFVTLTKVGWTVEEAARVLTTFMQYLRRGSRGKGPHKKGAREAYPVEYFAVLERHRDFDHNGFHWHLLVKGVQFLPNQVVSDALRSATKGRSYITKVKGVRNARAVGYVTKYLTKEITRGEKGVKEQSREMVELGLDEDGNICEKRRVLVMEVESKARRIRYSRGFFPMSVQALRDRLFADVDANSVELGAAVSGHQEAASPEEDVARSAWALYEHEECTHDVKAYRQRRRQALWEVLEDRQANGKRHSRRLLTMWHYQRGELRHNEKLGV